MHNSQNNIVTQHYLYSYSHRLSLCWLLATLVFLLSYFGSSGVQAQADDRPVSYWALVEESIRILEQDKVTADEFQQLIGRWQQLDTSQERFHPQSIVQQLQSGNHINASKQHLPMFLALQRTQQTWPVADSGSLPYEEVHHTLEEILAYDTYQYADESDNWLAQQYRQLLNRLEAWLSPNQEDIQTETDPAASGPAAAIGTDPIINIGGIVAAVALLFILFQLGRRITIGLNTEGVAVDQNEPIYEPLTVTEALAKADKTADSGNYRHSIRYLYLSTLLILEEKEFLKRDRSLTNQELLSMMNRYPQKAAVLQDVVNIFDRVWYGKVEIDPATLQRYRQQIQKLQEDEAQS